MPRTALRPGGILCRTSRRSTRLPNSAIRSTATLLRSRDDRSTRRPGSDRRSVRPDHRMVAHTGFLTTARPCHRPRSLGGHRRRREPVASDVAPGATDSSDAEEE